MPSNDDFDQVLRSNGYTVDHWGIFAQTLCLFDERCKRADHLEESHKEEGWWLSCIESTDRILDILLPVLTSRDNLRTLILDK